MAAVQTTETGKPHLAYFSARPFTKESIRGFVAQSKVLPLTPESDGLGCFTVVAELEAARDRTVTGGGKASVEQLRVVNTILGNLKTALTGAYHAVKFAKHAVRYLGEVQYRLSTGATTCARSCLA